MSLNYRVTTHCSVNHNLKRHMSEWMEVSGTSARQMSKNWIPKDLLTPFQSDQIFTILHQAKADGAAPATADDTGVDSGSFDVLANGSCCCFLPWRVCVCVCVCVGRRRCHTCLCPGGQSVHWSPSVHMQGEDKPLSSFTNRVTDVNSSPGYALSTRPGRAECTDKAVITPKHFQ